ncbi:hypothetical protein BGZ68_002790, partial [Mortierella alpina]
LLDGVVNLVGLIPGVGNVLKVLIDTVKALVDCLVLPVPSQIGGLGDCQCAGNGTVCSDKFPATCNKPANSVISCVDGTATACETGCSDGKCISSDCICASDVPKCGSSFPAKCTLLPNALYTCENDKPPKLLEVCDGLACATNGARSFCMDPCKCKDSNKACGSSFPVSCGLEKTALYTCSGVDTIPSALINCTLGCEFTTPDNRCTVDHSADVNAITSMLDTIIGTMNSNLRANNLTLVAFPPLVSLLSGVEANLTHTTDPKDLQPVLEAVNSAVNSLTHVFNDVKPPLDAINPTTQPLSLISNGTLSNLVQSICQCPRTNGSDCVGALELYRDYVASAQARTKLLGVGAMLAPLTRVSQDLTTSAQEFNVALPVENIAALNESASLLNKIIGYTSGNVQQYGNISDSVMLVYDSAKEVVVCKGLAASQFADKCSAYTDRLNGVLSDFIQFIETNIGFIPVVGPLIVNPLLDALRHLLIDIQNGVATALGGVVSLLNALVQVLNVVSPPSSTNVVRDYLLRLVGIMAVPAECGGLKDRCSGLFKIVHMITDGCLNLIGQIPLAGILIKPTLEPVLNGLLDALQKGVASAIKVALDLLDGVVKVVGLIPGVGNILKVLIDTVRALVDCLVVQVPSQLGGLDGCTCAGNGTVCSDRFPASCNKPANSVISCVDGTATACGTGCIDGKCADDDCKCTGDALKCGSVFTAKCKLLSNALYTCKDDGPPELFEVCDGLACATNGSMSFCMDPCKCKGVNKACGSSFPESCGLETTALYTCSGVDTIPSAPINCTLGCEFTTPDNRCTVDRSADVNAITSMLDTIIGTMNSNLRADNLTLVAFPPLVSLLSGVEANLTHTTDPKDLQPVLEAVNSAVNSLTHVFNDVKPPLDAINPTTQPLSLISNGTLSNLVQSICQCPRTNGSDCVGALKLYRDYVASAQARTKLLG